MAQKQLIDAGFQCEFGYYNADYPQRNTPWESQADGRVYLGSIKGVCPPGKYRHFAAYRYHPESGGFTYHDSTMPRPEKDPSRTHFESSVRETAEKGRYVSMTHVFASSRTHPAIIRK